MKLKIRVWLVLLLFAAITGCSPIKSEEPLSYFIVRVQCIPPNEGNYVHLFAVERITSEGIPETCDLDEIPCNEIPSEGYDRMDDAYLFYPSKMITKIRYLAVPSPGYRFDHWGFSPEDDYKDSFIFTNNSDTSWVAHFEPLPPIDEDEPSGIS